MGVGETRLGLKKAPLTGIVVTNFCTSIVHRLENTVCLVMNCESTGPHLANS